MAEHSDSFDKRIKEYEFTPAVFRTQVERYISHQQEIKDNFKTVFEKIDKISDRISSLPCDKHEGDKKVLETRLSIIEKKPPEDKRLVFISMFGCGALGGLIVSGVMKLSDIARIVIGGH